MKLTIVPNRQNTKTAMLQIDDARICYRNFRGAGSTYETEGARNFSVIIPDEEIAEALVNDKNEFGVGWNVKIKPHREEGDNPFMYMKVKIKYSDRSKPNVYLVSGRNKIQLDEETISMLDDITIKSVDMDIRPYDGEGRFGPHRTAYLQSIYVYQEVDRLAARFAEEDSEYPEEY